MTPAPAAPDTAGGANRRNEESTMAHPFDDPAAAYRVLVNGQQQHSLWPDDIALPAGWTPVFGPDTRDACTGYVEAAWKDMRPPSVRTGR